MNLMEPQDVSKEIKQLMKTERIIFGTERTLKALRSAQIEKVILSANAPAQAKSDIMQYAKLQSVEVIEAMQPNDELGVLCKKPFSVSVLSVKKE